MRFSRILFALLPSAAFAQQAVLDLGNPEPGSTLLKQGSHGLQGLEPYDVITLMKAFEEGDGLDEERVIQIFGEHDPVKVTEGYKFRLKQQGIQFMDITDHPYLGELNAKRLKPSFVPSRVQDSAKIKQMLDQLELDDSHLRADIRKLSSFWNRSYRSPWGALSSQWLYEKVLDTTKSSTYANISVRKFSHKKFHQRTVIARIQASEDATNPEDFETIIMGAHQDSLNYKMPYHRAPGADDDGSGTVTILQIFRSLLEGKFVPPSGIAIEFHWYAAEEGGLLGSQEVAAAYEKAGVNIRGMFQFDCTAFVKKDSVPIVAFFDEVVDMNLTNFAASLVDKYLTIGWNYTGCGLSCGSDHMSFTKAGYPAIFAAESLFEDFNDKFHTPDDDFFRDGQYNFTHMLEFVKLGIAFVAELAVQV